MAKNNSQKESAPKEKQTTFMGMPMNWDYANIYKVMWNKNDDRLFPPKAFGIGWTVNFYAVFKKTGVIKEK